VVEHIQGGQIDVVGVAERERERERGGERETAGGKRGG